MKAKLARPNYDSLTDEQLELLMLDWMNQELDITAEGAPLVLIMLGARVRDEQAKELRFDRERIIELSQNPHELVRAFELIDQAVSAWLATYLPDILSTQSFAIAVNQVQLCLVTALEPEELPYLVLYLRENNILEQVQSHPWGEPYQVWRLNADFVETYQRDWTAADLYRSEGEPSIVDQFQNRMTYTQNLATQLEAYIDSYTPPPQQDLMTTYCAAARALDADVSLLMDAERLLITAWEARTPINIEASLFPYTGVNF